MPASFTSAPLKSCRLVVATPVSRRQTRVSHAAGDRANWGRSLAPESAGNPVRKIPSTHSLHSPECSPRASRESSYADLTKLGNTKFGLKLGTKLGTASPWNRTRAEPRLLSQSRRHPTAKVCHVSKGKLQLLGSHVMISGVLCVVGVGEEEFKFEPKQSADEPLRKSAYSVSASILRGRPFLGHPRGGSVSELAALSAENNPQDGQAPGRSERDDSGRRWEIERVGMLFQPRRTARVSEVMKPVYRRYLGTTE